MDCRTEQLIRGGINRLLFTCHALVTKRVKYPVKSGVICFLIRSGHKDEGTEETVYLRYFRPFLRCRTQPKKAVYLSQLVTINSIDCLSSSNVL